MISNEWFLNKYIKLLMSSTQYYTKITFPAEVIGVLHHLPVIYHGNFYYDTEFWLRDIVK